MVGDARTWQSIRQLEYVSSTEGGTLRNVSISERERERGREKKRDSVDADDARARRPTMSWHFLTVLQRAIDPMTLSIWCAN